ncbi:hypothetical protein TIFTF001_031031 [Ficus carica]|uniref:Uncharacterized protein n=1 Tax=Ficus carica TaxID=3494 RepID=A0AA88DUB2_FICCA|nr:hypothetical protein TIFTF001_031031 [Ficus carica]
MAIGPDNPAYAGHRTTPTIAGNLHLRTRASTASPRGLRRASQP